MRPHLLAAAVEHLPHICCDVENCAGGNGTLMDWVRFLWDWHHDSAFGCATASKENIFMLYRETREMSSLQKDNYYQKMETAADQNLGLADCLDELALQSYADFNGINN